MLKAETHLLPGLLGLPFLMCYEALDQDICIGLIEMEVTRDCPASKIWWGCSLHQEDLETLLYRGYAITTIYNLHNLEDSILTPELEDNDTFDGNYLLKRNNWIGDDGTY